MNSSRKTEEGELRERRFSLQYHKLVANLSRTVANRDNHGHVYLMSERIAQDNARCSPKSDKSSSSANAEDSNEFSFQRR